MSNVVLFLSVIGLLFAAGTVISFRTASYIRGIDTMRRGDDWPEL